MAEMPERRILESIMADVDQEFESRHPEMRGHKLDAAAKEQKQLREEWKGLYSTRLVGVLSRMTELGRLE
jgi:hypothetical protein